ncbi:MAG TPA: TonB-dependent receptor [Sphingobacteriaceae bacterium]
MRNLFLLYLLLFFAGSTADVTAQTRPVTGTFNDISFDEFIEQLEKKTDYNFYYDPAGFDSLRVNISVNDKPLQEVFERLFKNTGYYWAIDQNRIFFTKGRKIDTSLPVHLFPAAKPAETGPGVDLADLSSNKTIEVPKASLENKLYEIGMQTASVTGNATLAGYAVDAKTGEPVIGAAVFIEQPRLGTTTDQFGYYALTIPKGRHTLMIRGIGIRNTRRQVMLYADGKLNLEIQPQVTSLREVVISAENAANVKSVQMGLEKINIATIKQVPAVFGEADVLRTVLTLPGVKSAGEASTGFNVRGGAVDQNLILFNDATIYNPSHFFGLFSAFNPEVVKDVELYKSSIPSKYGGRLSSVLEVNSREGNKKEITGTAGLGLLTSRINLEGPLIKDRSSFIVGARTTYSNWLLKALPARSGYRNSKASFNDLNVHLNHRVNENNDVYLTGYMSNDQSNLNSDTLYGYSNKNISLKWKHVFNNKLVGHFTTGYDRYEYENYSDKNPVNAFNLSFDINQLNAKADFSYYRNPGHTIDFGFSSIRYGLHPGTFSPLGQESLIIPDVVDEEQALESAVYFGNRYDVTSRLSVDFGLRYSLFNYLGPQSINTYAPNLPKDETTLTGNRAYGRGDLIHTYHGPEFRLSARYSITDDLSVKAGYNTLRQYVHMLSNTTAVSPTDIWKLSDPNIKPQYGDQIAIGLYKNFKSNTIETSAEVYFKNLKDYLDYKSGATLVLNHDIETAVFNARGKAYGAEVMIKKLTGKLNGWMSYAYSRTLLRMDDENAGEVINRGEYYPSTYDKPHDFTLIGNYRFSHRVSLSLNTTYSTGRPITLPIGKYYYNGSLRALYSDRNAYRIPDYLRADLSLNIAGNHKVYQVAHNYWTFGIYNVTGRKNAYSTYFTSEGGVIKGYKLSIFGSAIPFINYNIKF